MGVEIERPEKYSTVEAAKSVFRDLLADRNIPLPLPVRSFAASINIYGSSCEPTIPTPYRETEAISALKALEASLAIALAEVRYGIQQTASVDVDHATIFLFMSYLSTIDGMGKWNPDSVKRLKRKSVDL
jgi:hypothetical protein